MPSHFQPADLQTLAVDNKVVLVATRTPEGLPHLTLLTSFTPIETGQFVIGEFCRGLSKTHWQADARVGFLVMTLDRRVWRGHGRFTYLRREGPDYERLNDRPMFRYNSYFGINTVHTFDLVDVVGPSPLPIHRIAPGLILTRILPSRLPDEGERALPVFSERLFNRLGALKFVAWIAGDGFPQVQPLLQARAEGSRRLVWIAPGDPAVPRLPDGSQVGVYGLTLAMEGVFVRGTVRVERRCGLSVNVLDIEMVYNAAPPAHGVVWPRPPLEAVRDF